MDCETKYPILLVHGTGFRDRKYLNYWGRIPKALEEHGAKIYYGHQDCWGSIETNGATLKRNLEEILIKTQCGKVNIIAHSKGGLDTRYLISSLGMEQCVASLTTMATPHHGSKTIDLLCKLPKWVFWAAAGVTNLFFCILGDENPDFYTASHQFSTEYMKIFNRENPDAPAVYYQSYTAVMASSLSDLFMLLPNLFVRLVEGENDGLVTPTSAAWTNFRGVLRGSTRRGISHADEVDIRRMNFTQKKDDASDIRCFYINLVAELKAMGL